MDNFVQINVKDLPPPKPMVKILTALSSLESHQVLKVLHRREPFPLYEKLLEANWHYRCDKIADDDFVLYIFHLENIDLLNHLNDQTSA